MWQPYGWVNLIIKFIAILCQFFSGYSKIMSLKRSEIIQIKLGTLGSRYSRIDQVKFVEDSL